jgi:hypothetical protein
MSKWAVNQELRRIASARSAGRLAALETRPKPALPSVGKSGLSLRREHKLLTSGARGGIEPPTLRFSVQRIAATRDATWVRATGIFGRPDLRASRDSRLRLSLPHAARRRNGAGSALGPRNSSSRWLKFYSPTPQIARLVCPTGRKDVLFFDAVLPGFGVRVTATGTRVFRVSVSVRK